MARFMELDAAFDADRSWGGDRVPLRLAAVTLLTTPGDAAAIAAATRETDRALKQRLGWFSEVSAAVRLLIAAVLFKYGDPPDAFLDEIERVRPMFRTARVRQSELHECLAILMLRRGAGGQPIAKPDVHRFKAIYEEMKRHHWWLTGPEDFAACALLNSQPYSVEVIGERTDAVYRALHEIADLFRGDPLQTAANILSLLPLQAEEVATRFRDIRAAFRTAGMRTAVREYDEIAVLCFLAQPVSRVVDTVLRDRDELLRRLAWMTKPLAFSIAANLSFVRLVRPDDELGRLADVKLLLDMQTMVAARAAAASAAGAAGSWSART